MRSGESGLSITEALIALSLFSITALATAELSSNQAKSLKGNRLVTARDEIAHRIDRLAGDSRALAASAAAISTANAQFNGCVNGCPGGTLCCQSARTSFELFDPEGVRVTGAGAQPMFYGSSGEETGCSGGSATCPIAASTEFKPICPLSAGTCSRASAIEVYYQVAQANDSSGRPVQLFAGPPLRKVANTAAIVSAIPFSGGSAGFTGSGTPGHLAKWVTETQLDNARIHEDSAGRFGIGPVNPTSVLTVYDPSDTTITLARSGQPGTTAIWSYNTGTSVFGTVQHDALAFMTNGVVRMRIDEDGNITQPSDRRLKTAIAPLDGAVERVLSLNGVRYRWKDPSRGASEQIGLIAQDVEKAFPELVSRDESGIRSVSYLGLIAPLIEAIKSCFGEVDRVKNENDALKRRLAMLESRLAALEGTR